MPYIRELKKSLKRCGAPPGIEAGTLISFDPMLGFALGAVFFGGLSRGFAGFGAALIIVPALTLVWPCPGGRLMSLIEVPGALQLARTAVKKLTGEVAPLYRRRRTIPIGAWMLAILDAVYHPSLDRRDGCLFGAMIATGWRYKGEVTKALIAPLGRSAASAVELPVSAGRLSLCS